MDVYGKSICCELNGASEQGDKLENGHASDTVVCSVWSGWCYLNMVSVSHTAWLYDCANGCRILLLGPHYLILLHGLATQSCDSVMHDFSLWHN